MGDLHEMKASQIRILHGLSALIPILILGIAFARIGIYPFGDRQILVTDFWQQYYPFLSDYWYKLRGGNSLLWSWTAGGGHDYIAHIAYYMASPLNLLTALFPHRYLREVLTALLLVKIGVAGFNMSMYLRLTLKKCDMLLPIFSSLYALCAFVLGYYWNIMWMDTFALMPLVILGVHSLMREGKYKLYIIALALSILFNFYISLFVCIFVVIMFFINSVTLKITLKEMFQKLIMIGVYSVIAVGISAILTLPTYSALSRTFGSSTPFPGAAVFYNSFAAILGNFIAFTPPTSLDGLPNLYSGMISVMLLPVFLISKKVSIREKIAYMVVLVFIIFSVNLNALYFIWNGFHFSNMLPFRFSFLVSFILVFVSYKAYLLLDEIKWRDVLAMGLAAAFFIAMAIIGTQETEHIRQAAILSSVYLAVFIFAAGNIGTHITISMRTKLNTNEQPAEKNGHVVKTISMLKFVFFAVILFELFFTAHNGVHAVRTTDRTAYPTQYAEVQQLLDKRELIEPDFFRTEFTRWWSTNDPSLYGFNGISFFSSMVNVSNTNFISGLGLPGWDRGNRFTYAETSPLTNAFLNIRYLIARDGSPTDDGVFFDYVASVDNLQLLRNNRYLPFGFMVNEDIVYYVADMDNPFNSQNDLFRLATGIDEDLFDITDIIHVGHRNYLVLRQGLGEYTFTLQEDGPNGMFRFTYEMPTDNSLMYVYFRVPTSNNNARVVAERDVLRTLDIRRSYLFFAGRFNQGELISIEADSENASGRAYIFVGLLNQELFERGFEQLSAETLTLTEFTDTRVRGTITTAEGGLLYTSLPHANNWRVSVNGTRQEIVTVGGAMAAVRLEPGTHIVEFRYSNSSFTLGVIVTVGSIFMFAMLIWLQKKEIDIFKFVFDRFLSTKVQQERVSYLFFGVLTTLVNWTIFTFIVQLTPRTVAVSNLIAWACAMTFAFIVNKIFVFESQSWAPSVVGGQAITFFGTRLVTGLIEIIGVPLLVFMGIAHTILGIEGFVAKMLVSIFVIIANYIFCKFIVFQVREKSEVE